MYPLIVHAKFRFLAHTFKYLILDFWKFGDFKHYTSLKLLPHVLGIPSPKEDIDGSMIRDVYYKENDLERIVHCCERDVVTVAQIFLRHWNEQLLSEDQIVQVQ